MVHGNILVILYLEVFDFHNFRFSFYSFWNPTTYGRLFGNWEHLFLEREKFSFSFQRFQRGEVRMELYFFQLFPGETNHDTPLVCTRKS